MTPYFAHVARVTLILRHLFEVSDLDVLTASLLHDVIRGYQHRYTTRIAEIFGARVIKCTVILLTKNKMLSRKLREKDYELAPPRRREVVQIAKLADAF